MLKICRVLELSVRHLSRFDKQTLDRAARGFSICAEFPAADKYDFGWYVRVPEMRVETEETLLTEGCPRSFVELLKLASKEECAIIRFDRDGPIHDKYPTYHVAEVKYVGRAKPDLSHLPEPDLEDPC